MWLVRLGKWTFYLILVYWFKCKKYPHTAGSYCIGPGTLTAGWRIITWYERERQEWKPEESSGSYCSGPGVMTAEGEAREKWPAGSIPGVEGEGEEGKWGIEHDIKTFFLFEHLCSWGHHFDMRKTEEKNKFWGANKISTTTHLFLPAYHAAGCSWL